MSTDERRRKSSGNRTRGNAPTGTRNNNQNRQVTSTQAARAKKKKRERKRKTLILMLEVLVVLVLLLVAFVWTKMGKVNWDETIEVSDLQINELDEETEALMDEYTTIALFGVDNRTNGDYESGNSDSMMIVSINNETKEVNVVSVMRDTYMRIDSSDKYRKCNYAYNHGGPKTSLNMLNANLDIQVDGYVAVDFMALAQVVDAVGGIEVDITKSFLDATNPSTGLPAFASYIAEVSEVTGIETEWYLDPGYQTLDGVQTVAYCRNRYAGGDDYARTERQREVILKIVEKLKTAKPNQLNDVIDAILPQVSTSLTAPQVLGLAYDLTKYQVGATCGFPFDLTTGEFGDKGSLVVPCTLEDNVVKLHKFLYNQEQYEPTATVKGISQQIMSDTNTNSESATKNQVADGTE
ncbi:MAG: LCP family protein [Pseudobutyrivibrio sp.]|nr:LCP family protein [Pseudobutyrivibrio sp.]